MFLAELDPVQIIIIVIAMGAGFVQWLWGLLKQKLDENERRNAPPISDEERAAREEAWRRQVEQAKPGRVPPRSPTSTPPINPWETVRDVFEKIQEESRRAHNPETPPPVPQRPSATQAPAQPARRVRPGTVEAEWRPAPSPPPLPAAPFPAAHVREQPVAATPPVFFAQSPAPPQMPSAPALLPSSRQTSPEMHGLRQLLKTPASIRQAVLLREILGPPKALQSSDDSPF